MNYSVSHVRRARRLLLFFCFIFACIWPVWSNIVVVGALASPQKSDLYGVTNAPAFQISPLSPLESPPRIDAIDASSTTVSTMLPEPAVNAPSSVEAEISAPLTTASGPFYSGVSGNQVSPVLVGAILVSLLGVGVMIMMRQR